MALPPCYTHCPGALHSGDCKHPGAHRVGAAGPDTRDLPSSQRSRSSWLPSMLSWRAPARSQPQLPERLIFHLVKQVPVPQLPAVWRVGPSESPAAAFSGLAVPWCSLPRHEPVLGVRLWTFSLPCRSQLSPPTCGSTFPTVIPQPLDSGFGDLPQPPPNCACYTGWPCSRM